MSDKYLVSLSIGSGKMGANDKSKTKRAGPNGPIRSLNVNPKDIEYCVRAHYSHDINNVCVHCYMFNLLETCRQNCATAWSTNGYFLSKFRMDVKNAIEPPRKGDDIIRIYSGGEDANMTAVDNINRYVELHDHVHFTKFTKRLDLMSHPDYYVPDNMTLIWSNPRIDDVKQYAPHYLIDGIFNVVRDHQDPRINCTPDTGACRRCMNCYGTKKPRNRVIVEGLK